MPLSAVCLAGPDGPKTGLRWSLLRAVDGENCRQETSRRVDGRNDRRSNNVGTKYALVNKLCVPVDIGTCAQLYGLMR